MSDFSDTDLDMLKLKSKIMIDDINAFDISSRDENDSKNKMRERIINNIINSTIPLDYYNHLRWCNLKREIDSYIHKLMISKNIDTIHHIKCVIMAGRKNNYDYIISINDEVFNVELKYNAEKVNDTPQFVSPMNPSQYMINDEKISFENHHHRYLSQILKNTSISVPPLDVYNHDIHSTKPKCFVEAQNKYYKGCSKSSQYTGEKSDIDFYIRANQISKESIKEFIRKSDIDTKKLTDYLLKTQIDKNYMLYKDGKFHLEQINYQHYTIVSCEKNKQMNGYIATSEAGNKIKILLRWKNGNGIAFPAFQIK
jgi:hypothetical protein